MATVHSLFDLRDRVAIVTGAFGLLGRKHCEVLAGAGAHIIMADLEGACDHGWARLLAEQTGRQILPMAVDVCEKESVARMVDNAIGSLGRIDILINNAALTVKGGSARGRDYFAPFENYPLDLWEKALQVSVTGTFLCSQAVGSSLARQRKGVIINVCSIYGIVAPDQRIYQGVPNPYDASLPLNTPASYSAAKGALVALTRYLAAYWAEKNVRVNALTPGGVQAGHDDVFVRNYSYRTPMGRMADPSEFRGAVLFLASDASSYMTGANLVVDGGWTAW